jgi:alkanesulfonate monooxygenase SsuD/methylene tetrahydromethanopterin reductase-like flavin-dependent oxidoreductase (luciferase family)
LRLFAIGLTDHLEGPLDRPSTAIFDELADIVRLADRVGVDYAWFSEHHAHAHEGHLPAPLLFALHMAAQTRRIHLGTAIICLNLHHPLHVAEHVAVADALTGGRMAPGFGSGSTPEEFGLFGLKVTEQEDRHARFEEGLRVILAAWGRDGIGSTCGPEGGPTSGDLRDRTLADISANLAPADSVISGTHSLLPVAAPDLPARSWVAVNSAGSARIAGALNFNVLFSHLRTPEQYRQYAEVYRAAGGTRRIAANRPVFVGPDDSTALEQVEPALRILWRRFRQEGKIPAGTPEPADPRELCGHPINFLVGGPQSVARGLLELYEQVPFDVANVEIRWAGLGHEVVRESLRRLMEEVMPLAKPV